MEIGYYDDDQFFTDQFSEEEICEQIQTAKELYRALNSIIKCLLSEVIALQDKTLTNSVCMKILELKFDLKIINDFQYYLYISSNFFDMIELPEVNWTEQNEIIITYEVTAKLPEIFWNHFEQKLETLLIIYPFVNFKFKVTKYHDTFTQDIFCLEVEANKSLINLDKENIHQRIFGHVADFLELEDGSHHYTQKLGDNYSLTVFLGTQKYKKKSGAQGRLSVTEFFYDSILYEYPRMSLFDDIGMPSLKFILNKRKIKKIKNVTDKSDTCLSYSFDYNSEEFNYDIYIMVFYNFEPDPQEEQKPQTQSKEISETELFEEGISVIDEETLKKLKTSLKACLSTCFNNIDHLPSNQALKIRSNIESGKELLPFFFSKIESRHEALGREDFCDKVTSEDIHKYLMLT
ncbi:unnamed protein product [Moneuplotes crassus]|uniref:Uncharacterized protein n=1 Tax=Euplotes crassus TaxID=5936 RepID=A0AAD1XGI6_EUPCR|nr:unnamed protein product [Moneuplotes crassus]